MKDYRIYWIWLAETLGYGSELAVKLVNAFGNASVVYGIQPCDIDSLEEGVLTEREVKKAKLLLETKDLSEAERILEDAAKAGQRVLVPTDRDYPQNLTSLRNAPMVLYVKGRLPEMNDTLCVSVVGTRTMSEAGRRNSYAMGYGLAAGGAIVVSGMALGCDGAALCGAVNGGGRTVAVLGCGVDVIYPKDHACLYDTILKNGAIVSEYPPGTRPIKYHFPQRNRIISGLSSGSVIVEGNLTSGALITAKHAIVQGRNVFAMPGEVGAENSAGVNELIKSGVFTALSAEDVLAEYEFIYPHCVNMKTYRRAMRKLDVEAESADATAKLRVSSRGGKNFYGTSSYGGRDTLASVLPFASKPKAPKTKRSDRKNADAPVSMGRMAEPVKTSPRKEETLHAPAEERHTTTLNRAELDILEEINIKVYGMMKPDVPTLPDELASSGISVSDVMSSLAVLEIVGMVEAHPGGYFTRISEEDIVFDAGEA
ncbi:MAG: DNA-processing protein DprA [Clostridia bacterium]|nr:DNA-processing protein DprA [Clostridia bacterium]